MGDEDAPEKDTQRFDLVAGLTYELIEGLVDRILVYDDTRIEIVW